MRMLRGGIAILVVLAAASAQPALAQQPIEIKSSNDFFIKPSNLPPGCKIVTFYDNRGSLGGAEITCDSKEHMAAGFVISDKLEKTCADKGSKIVCTIKDS